MLGAFFVRSDLPSRLDRARYISAFCTCFGSNLVQSAELFDGFCSPIRCFELQSAESCASVTARLKRSATIIIEVWQHA
ncbi:hypothetical protein HMPREF1580_01348 [Gardnerella vaginalis JCP8070]|nr:hypothetical protein HMPREF1580_01348 [Gardnerella vaginalis JCP8070]